MSVCPGTRQTILAHFHNHTSLVVYKIILHMVACRSLRLKQSLLGFSFPSIKNQIMARTFLSAAVLYCRNVLAGQDEFSLL